MAMRSYGTAKICNSANVVNFIKIFSVFLTLINENDQNLLPVFYSCFNPKNRIFAALIKMPGI